MIGVRTLAVTVCLLALTCTLHAADEDGFVAMFNGSDLTGWQGKPGAWRVEDGAITGESTKQDPCDKTHYLYWQGGEPADFILRCQIKLIGGNSGIQFRSETRPDFDTFGYQADFDAIHQWTGSLYQHHRGAVVTRGNRAEITESGKRQETSFATAAALAKKVKNNDWNDYEIAAQGSNVTLRINNTLMCQVDDRDSKLTCKKGIIALQMHQGPPMKVQFRNLRIKVLSTPAK